MIWTVSALGSGVKRLIEFWADRQGRGVEFRSQTDGIDTTTRPIRPLLSEAGSVVAIGS
jgi:hypothetical protein